VLAGLSAVMGLAVGLLLIRIDDLHPVAQVAVCTVAGAVVYFGLGRLLFNGITGPLVRSARMILRSGGRMA
jgi:hypothetical protein